MHHYNTKIDCQDSLTPQGVSLISDTPTSQLRTLSLSVSNCNSVLLNSSSFDVENASKVPLGKNSEITAPPPSESFENKHLSKWQLQRSAGIALPGRKWRRLHFCHKIAVNSDGAHVFRHNESGSLHYAGLATCGSIWSCPVCSPKITERRRVELSLSLEKASMLGLTPYLLTLTAPHNKSDRLEDLLKKNSDALALMKHRKPFKRLMKKMGMRGYIRSLEVTEGDNGWHVHFHIILFFDEWKKPLESSEVLPLWQDACLSVGLQSPNEHGVDIKVGNEKIGDYVSKWGLECEVTKSMIKKGRFGRRSPWDLLRDFTATGNEDSSRLYREYSECFKGRKQLVWSKGLRELLKMEPEKSDEEIAEEQVEDCTFVCTIPLDVWRLVVSRELRGQLLDAISGGPDGMQKFIDENFNSS